MSKNKLELAINVVFYIISIFGICLLTLVMTGVIR